MYSMNYYTLTHLFVMKNSAQRHCDSIRKEPVFLLWLSTVPHQYPSWESCKLLNVAAVDQHLCVGMGSL